MMAPVAASTDHSADYGADRGTGRRLGDVTRVGAAALELVVTPSIVAESGRTGR